MFVTTSRSMFATSVRGMARVHQPLIKFVGKRQWPSSEYIACSGRYMLTSLPSSCRSFSPSPVYPIITVQRQSRRIRILSLPRSMQRLSPKKHPARHLPPSRVRAVPLPSSGKHPSAFGGRASASCRTGRSRRSRCVCVTAGIFEGC